MVANPLTDAVALHPENMGVWLEDSPRKVQDDSEYNNGFWCSLNREWLAKLDLDEQGAATLHSLSVANSPVIVKNPAIIIQPAHALDTESEQ